LVPPDIEVSPQLLALIAIEDAQRNADARAKPGAQWWSAVVRGRLIAHIYAQSRIGRPVRDRQAMIDRRLGHGLVRRLEIGTRVGGGLPQRVLRRYRLCEVVHPCDVELVERCALVEQA